MPTEVSCPTCGKAVVSDDPYAVVVRCRECGEHVRTGAEPPPKAAPSSVANKRPGKEGGTHPAWLLVYLAAVALFLAGGVGLINAVSAWQTGSLEHEDHLHRFNERLHDMTGGPIDHSK